MLKQILTYLSYLLLSWKNVYGIAGAWHWYKSICTGFWGISFKWRCMQKLFHTSYPLFKFFLLMLIKFSVPFYGLSFKVAISLYRWGCAFWVVFFISYSKNPILNSFTSQDYGIYEDAPFWKELFPCNSEVSWKFCWINVIRYFVVLYVYQNRFRAAYNLVVLIRLFPLIFMIVCKHLYVVSHLTL